MQNFTEIVSGEPRRRGVKRKMGIATYVTFGYLISWWLSCKLASLSFEQIDMYLVSQGPTIYVETWLQDSMMPNVLSGTVQVGLHSKYRPGIA